MNSCNSQSVASQEKKRNSFRQNYMTAWCGLGHFNCNQDFVPFFFITLKIIICNLVAFFYADGIQIGESLI